MKKYIIALIGALAAASLPLNAHATDNCVIKVNSGESQTINYATECRVENYGVLNVTSGANITKNTQDAYAAIENYGTLNIGGGSIYADYGYAVRNRGGYINMYGGTVNSALHQAIWVTSGTVKVTGGTLKSAGGYEENIYTTGKLITCNDSYTRNPEAQVDSSSCPKPVAQAAPKAAAPAASNKSETITITINSTEKKTTTTTTTPNTTAPVSTVTTNVKPVAAKEETKTEAILATAKIETPIAEEDIKEAPETVAKVDEKTVKESVEEEVEEEKTDHTLGIIISATIAVLGSASVALLLNRLRDCQ